MKIIFYFSVILISMNHPMLMLLSVIAMTLLISLMFYQNSCNSLLPLILILLVLGGMMIIFMYMVSLCPNKKMQFNKKIIFLIIFLIFLKFSFIFVKIENQEFFKLYCYPFMNLMIFMLIYLLICLLVVMKLLNWISSPMKSLT
uniref:NADH dehydrogenase subunit 6 n=1 Tax=Amblyomma argentinae TaxID=705545 RepID=UPI002E77B6AD|nr:NADH dehydrogenase subunit 6 [Amblyomma argentinae]WQF68976.1 NADH dehydrogenase subunit 6 [Amblyomma argentinae]